MKNRNEDYFFDDDDDVVADGCSVRVPLPVMDSSKSSKRVTLTDTVRFDQDGEPCFLRSVDSLRESSNAEKLESSRSSADPNAAREVRAARQRWIAEMCDAWK